MGIITVRCPQCGEYRPHVTPNTGFTCKGCGARVSVDNNGKPRIVSRGK